MNERRTGIISRSAAWYCSVPRVVGQEKIINEIYGIASSKPDYVVFVNCGIGLSRAE
jgi:hypothetical protein